MEQAKISPSIAFVIEDFLEVVRLGRSQNTAITYSKALKEFKKVLIKSKIDPEISPANMLTEDMVSKLVMHLKTFAPATEQLYIRAVARFYKFLAAEHLAEINLPRMDLLIDQRARKPGIRLPQFPADEIERLLEKVENVGNLADPAEGDNELEAVKLRAYRDRAFLVTLADTGFRVHEACKLRRGDMDWNEGYAIIIGKGDKQAVVRFTSRSIQAIKEYLSQRAVLDGNSGKQLTSLPLFARHDKGAGKKVKPMTPTTGRNIVNERVEQLLGKELVGKITPHSFRHYFVTSVLRGTGNLATAQKLARHENIETTKRYTHLTNDELDKAYYEVFEKNSKWRTK